MDRLSKRDRAEALGDLPDWTWDEGRDAISRRFVFGTFSEAFAFMVRVALEAERADHHPDWSNAWNRVDISLTTHEANGLSVRDIALARAIDRMHDARQIR